MWGLHIEGVTMPAQQEQTEVYRWEYVLLKLAPYTILFIVDDTISPNGHLKRGIRTRYYESATRMR